MLVPSTITFPWPLWMSRQDGVMVSIFISDRRCFTFNPTVMGDLPLQAWVFSSMKENFLARLLWWSEIMYHEALAQQKVPLTVFHGFSPHHYVGSCQLRSMTPPTRENLRWSGKSERFMLNAKRSQRGGYCLQRDENWFLKRAIICSLRGRKNNLRYHNGLWPLKGHST